MSDEQQSAANTSPFDNIKRTAEDGDGLEYWSGRDLAEVLGYTTWRRFAAVIDRAEQAATGSGLAPRDHFDHVVNMVKIGSGARRKTPDVRLTRYGAYLVAMNADPSKDIVAQAQTYFAQQTRRAELADAEAFATLPEDNKRLSLRSEMRRQDQALTATAEAYGVQTAADHEEFQEAGYKGLYGELSRAEIKEKKELPADADLLDHAGSSELAINLFRATQAEQRLRREQPDDAQAANALHHDTGQQIRTVITGMGNIPPEDLPTAVPPIPELEASERKRLITKGKKNRD